MFILKSQNYLLIVLALLALPLKGKDVLLEFKGAYFHAAGSHFKEIFKNGGAWYGPEITFALSDCYNLYGFASVDYFKTDGHSVGLENPTKISLLPISVGLKYLMPTCWPGTDFYVGLGFEPIRVHIRNDSPFVIQRQTKWVLGGIAKMGAYIDLSCNFVLDLFIDYSFAHVSSHNTNAPTGPIVPLKSSISGVIIGAGLGYWF